MRRALVTVLAVIAIGAMIVAMFVTTGGGAGSGAGGAAPPAIETTTSQPAVVVLHGSGATAEASGGAGSGHAIRPTAAAPAPTATVEDLRGEGLLLVRIVDEAGHPIPARLTFVGVGRTPRPRFTTADIAREQPGAILAYDRAFVLGDARLRIPPGEYDVWASHGPEWDVAVHRLTVKRIAPTSMSATLHHVIDTPGWISGDFHVHAQESFDSKVPMRDRVHQFVADGVDLIVATDHNVIADYAPVIAELGQTARLASLQGDEITTRDWGHFGAFPLPGDDVEAGRGAVPVEGRTPEALFADVRVRAPDAVIDVHHPRLENGHIGYFHLAKLDAATLHARRPGFSMDFDAIEVLNGYQDPDRRSVDLVLADWYAFLRHGRRVTATGNSDTHHLTFNLGGYPRNYVHVADDRPDHLDPAALIAAIKGGRAYFTTAPIVDVSIGDRGLGDTVTAARGAVEVHVRVRAPAWVAVDRVSVLLDGVRVAERAARGHGTVRLDDTIRVPVSRDGFLIVRVDGDRPMAPVIGDGDRFKVFPLAITNPIWIDADGDGTITPEEPGAGSGSR
jgi:hypothetical protein